MIGEVTTEEWRAIRDPEQAEVRFEPSLISPTLLIVTGYECLVNKNFSKTKHRPSLAAWPARLARRGAGGSSRDSRAQAGEPGSGPGQGVCSGPFKMPGDDCATGARLQSRRSGVNEPPKVRSRRRGVIITGASGERPDA